MRAWLLYDQKEFRLDALLLSASLSLPLSPSPSLASRALSLSLSVSLSLSLFLSLSLSFLLQGMRGVRNPPIKSWGALEEREKAGLFPPGMKEFL